MEYFHPAISFVFAVAILSVYLAMKQQQEQKTQQPIRADDGSGQ